MGNLLIFQSRISSTKMSTNETDFNLRYKNDEQNSHTSCFVSQCVSLIILSLFVSQFRNETEDGPAICVLISKVSCLEINRRFLFLNSTSCHLSRVKNLSMEDCLLSEEDLKIPHIKYECLFPLYYLYSDYIPG